ncbi:MAG: aminotransferase class IV [Rickettsiaceae bacterium]|nr:aminotransferase class IV [Rickettsiaceae bacterium]
MNFKLSNKMSDYIWINGEIVPWDEAYVHVLTHSLHYAGAVYEGERAYNGKIFKLMEHTNRLLRSAEAMHLKVNFSADEINQATHEVLRLNNLKDAYVRPLIWRGAETLGAYNPILKCNILVLATESSPTFKNDMKLYVTPWRKIGVDAMPPQCKSSAHYAMMTVSQKLAQDLGYDDALILDQYDDIAESSTTNIFFGKSGTIVTPIADRFLDGITRQTVMEIARNIGMEVTEERLLLSDIGRYDSCFLTGTSAEIKGVSSISYDTAKVEFPNNDLVTRLQQEYAKIVGKIL